MKKMIPLLVCLLLALTSSASAETLVASFHPVYLFALNLTQGIDSLEVHCLTAPGTGCLHDYQLSTADMKALAQADAFLINGAGMESYLSFVTESLPSLQLIDCSDGVALLEDDDGDEPYNSHIWLSAKNAIQMVNNLANGLVGLYPVYADQLNANRETYVSRLQDVDDRLLSGLAPLSGQKIITFHEAFPYFAEAYGLKVAAVITHDSDDSLSAFQLSQLISLVKSVDHPVLFVEPQYDDIIARTISGETGAPIYVLDPCVTAPEGDQSLTQYEDVMLANLNTLLEAFQ